MSTFNPDPAPRPLFHAIRRGAACRCPSCGEGRLYRAYLKPTAECSTCGLTIDAAQRADDLPPFLTILIAGHLLMPLVIYMTKFDGQPYWLIAAVALSAALGLCAVLLPPVKGAVIGVQWANRMHGFDDSGVPGAGDRVSDPDADRS